MLCLRRNQTSWLLSVGDLQGLLRPHLGRLARVVWPIWNRYSELPEDHRLGFDPTTEANVLHSYMVQTAKREFDNVPGVQFLETYGFHLGLDGTGYGISGQAVCRFKKFSDDGRTSNYLTDRQEALRRNEQLDGMPERATYVDIGYSLNPLRTGIIDVQAIRVVDNKLVLSIPRTEGQSSEMPGMLPFGPTPAAPRFEVIGGRGLRRAQNDRE